MPGRPADPNQAELRSGAAVAPSSGSAVIASPVVETWHLARLAHCLSYCRQLILMLSDLHELYAGELA